MIKTMLPLFTLSTGIIAAGLRSACATASPEDYANLDCKDMRALVSAQDSAASVRSIDLINDRGMEEIRQESGSPWTGRTRTRDEGNVRDERRALREAYRRKGCKA